MPAEVTQFVHEAVFFESQQEFLDCAVPFLLDGLAAGADPVLACSPENTEALLDVLGHDARVVCLPRPEVYGKAVTSVAFLRDFMQRREAAGAPPVRLVGEIDFGASLRAWDEWRRFEALCNHALAPYPMWSLCAYDAARLPDAVLATGELSHPFLHLAGERHRNPLFVDPAELLSLPAGDLEPLPDIEPVMTVGEAYDLRGLHHQLRELLQTERVRDDLVDDLVLSVIEVATNGLRHGVPPVTVRVWLPPGRVVCTVTDHGPGFDAPLAGYVLDEGDGEPLPEGRFGLWLARRLCDELVTCRTPEGFTVRLVAQR